MKSKIAIAVSVFLALTVLLISCLTELEAGSVTVTFDTDGGTPVPEPVTITRGTTLGELTTPTKGSDQFIGWYDGFDKYTEDTVINKDITLTAKWGWEPPPPASMVTVTFSTPGAVPPETIVTVSPGKALGPMFPVDPRRKGFRFDGWELSSAPFTKSTVINGNQTVTAKWTAKTAHTVTLRVTATHQAANPGIDGTIFEVFDGDSIDEWEPRFPKDLGTAPDPDENRFYKFFRWSVGGNAGGIIYTERTPIESDVTLTTYYGMYFHPREFDVDFSTMGLYTGTTAIDRKPYVGGPGPDITMPGDTRPAGLGSPLENADGSVTVSFHASPAFLWFKTPEDLRPLLNQASVANETQFRWEIEYTFADPLRETPDNQFNFLIANVRTGEGWNSTDVKDLTLDEITNGSGEGATAGEIHNVIGTISNVGSRDYIVIRGGRGTEVGDKGPFTITFKSIKIHLVQ
jgi:uncharacterized repeat protein (TIGR02543 family)